jgi:phospholipase D-like protein
MKEQSFVELLAGERAELALLATFNFEPVFFEACLLRTRALAEARRIVIFTDAGEWSRTDTTGVRGLNCRYLVVPIRRRRGVFHPKLALLLSAKSAALIGGSANLSRAGCTHNLELLNSFQFYFGEDSETPAQSALLADALDFFRGCLAESPDGLRKLAGEWLEQLPSALPWLSFALAGKRGPSGCKLCYTLDDDLLSVIRLELDGRPPRVIRILSPFYDDDLTLAARFRSEWPSCRLEITAQQRTSTVPVKALAEHGSKVTLYELRGAGSRRLHAKLCAFEYARGTLFLAGSANFTTAAFDGRNVETCFVWHDREKHFDDLFAGDISRRITAAEDFDPGEETPPERRAVPPSGWQVQSAILDGDGRLQVQFNSAPSPNGDVTAHLFVLNEIRPVLAIVLSTNGRDSGDASLTSNQIALLSGPVRCELRHGAQTSGSAWLVQEMQLTHEPGGGRDRSTEREQTIRETGGGLLEHLDELGKVEGVAAVIEYLKRLNIRFQDDEAQSTRPFSVKPRDPFCLDELPSWLILSTEQRKDYGAAVIDFAERHEKRIFRAHARHASLGGWQIFRMCCSPSRGCSTVPLQPVT